MNKLTIIGNLTKDPEVRTTPDGASVCDFTVAVNRRGKNQNNEADFFRVSAWRGLAETCGKYLAKGRKVAVTGSVRMRLYTGNDGQARGSMEVTADDVEFLTPKGEQANNDAQTGFQTVVPDDLPFELPY